MKAQMRTPNVKFCLASSCMLALLISVFASTAQTSESDVKADGTITTTVPTQSPGTGCSRSIQGNETGQLADHAAVRRPPKPVPSGPADTDTRKPQSKKIVCFGDSITKRGYPEHLAKILGVRVVNAGVAGNTTRHALRRLKSDVLDQRPDAVVILFGTNDSRMAEERVHVPLEKFESNLDAMIAKCRKENIAVVVGTLPPIDADAYFTRHASENFDRAGGFRTVLEAYRQAVLRLAANHQAPVVDLHRLLADQPGWRHQDGVHPTSEGNKVIATLVAKEVRRLVTSSAAPCESAAHDVKQQDEANVAVAAPSEDG